MKLVTPATTATAGAAPDRRLALPMHCRFEVNFIVDRILGGRPKVRILVIAWQDKREHIRRFLLDYYARYHRLPMGRHDLGSTPNFRLEVGFIDFGEVRREIRHDLQHRHRGWRRWLGSRLGFG